MLENGRLYGFRNAQATVLAPTGTISFLMDCDTTGIEPDIALVKYKQLAGGGMLKIVNNTVPLALKTLGYDQPEIESILGYIDREDTIEGAANLKAEHLPVFDCAFQPRNGTRSHPLAGSRADDGSRAAVPVGSHLEDGQYASRYDSGRCCRRLPGRLATGPQGAGHLPRRLQGEPTAVHQHRGRQSGRRSSSAAPRRERLPDTRQSVTHKFNIAGHEGYITVGLYENGRPGEMFITMAKEGSTIGGLMDCFGTAMSMSLQYGVPLEVYVNKFSHTRFEPMGHTKNPDIRIAKSIVDYIFRWLGITFLPGYREASAGLPAPAEPGSDKELSGEDPPGDSKPAAMKAGGQKAGPGLPNANGTKTSTAKSSSNGASHGASESVSKLLERAGIAPKWDPATSGGNGVMGRSDQFASFQVDAPACDNCGAITVRNGNCYLCHNCGNSMGCS